MFAIEQIQSGAYRALLYNDDGCTALTAEKIVAIETPRLGIRYPTEYAVVNYPHQLKARDFGIGLNGVRDIFKFYK
jgi:hypothetical protein